ncbi:RrF2 family transcriptional regulator [Butyrivibrio sp.]|uniref:RrF2 family transcriptional regulator n=1 Tax=Butyrivibrio sp. TaxID=28121 RepID=UPI003FA4B050
MKISTKGRYALKIMMDIALHDNGDYISLKDISKRQNITVKYLEQIVSGLNKSGFLLSMRGNNGGYRLAREPKDCNIGEILRTVEGSLTPIECVAGDTGNPCPLSDSCSTLPFWTGLDKVVNDYINSYTLQDLIDQN